MHRQQLKILLENYHPADSAEQKYKPIMLDFLASNAHCFERSLCCGHFTASCWLLNQARTHALLMHHAKLNQWLQLGGHCDGDGNTLSVAIKEASEESGINAIIPLSHALFDIDIHWIPSNKKEKGHYHYDIRYLLGVNSDESLVQNSESHALRWIGKQESLPTINPAVSRMMHKWRALAF